MRPERSRVERGWAFTQVAVARPTLGDGEARRMKRHLRCFTVFSALLGAIFGAEPGLAQKPGGILRLYHWDSPASMSIHEEVTLATDVPMMGVFNNLVLFDQHVVRNSLQSIMPELANSWSWSEDGMQLT